MQTCEKCGQDKPLDQFPPVSTGRALWCYTCIQTYNREKEERGLRTPEGDPLPRRQVGKYKSQYYAEHLEERRKYARERYRARAGELRERSRAAYWGGTAPPEKVGGKKRGRPRKY